MFQQNPVSTSHEMSMRHLLCTSVIFGHFDRFDGRNKSGQLFFSVFNPIMDNVIKTSFMNMQRHQMRFPQPPKVLHNKANKAILSSRSRSIWKIQNLIT